MRCFRRPRRASPGPSTAGRHRELPWDAPDLQGLWTSATLTPLERPRRQPEKARLTDEEAAALERQSEERRAASDGKSEPGSVGGYNQVWMDAGTQIADSRRTSLIVDPPEGVIPWRSEAKIASDREQARYGVGPYASWLDLDMGERCITDGLPNMVPLQPYNMNLQILQTPGAVVMLHEMYHELRVIPLDGRPLTGITQWTGEARGRWDGDTLVVGNGQFCRQAGRLLEHALAEGPLQSPSRRAFHARRPRGDRLYLHPRRPARLHPALDRDRADDDRPRVARRHVGANL